MQKEIHKVIKVRMSQSKMADLMYAIIMTGSKVKSTLTIGCEKYTRKQNSHNYAEVLIIIDPAKMELFNSLFPCEFKDPVVPKLN